MKYHVADIRHKAFESVPGNINNRSYYDKWFRFETNGLSQNELFVKNITLSMEGWCLDWFRKTVNVTNFMKMVVGMFTNIMTRYGSFIYIYLIQTWKISLRQQLISIHYWLGCLRKTDDKRWNNAESNRLMHKSV